MACFQILQFRGQRLSGIGTWFSFVLCSIFVERTVAAADSPTEMRKAMPDGAAPRNVMKKPVGLPSAPSKVIRYAERLLEKYDFNHDGVLQKDEWMSLHGHPEFIDTNRDGVINLDELVSWVADYGRRKRIGIPVEAEPAAEPTAEVVPSAAPKADTSTTPAEDPSSTTASGPPSTMANGERRRDSKFFVPSNRLPAGLPEWFIAKDLDGDGQLTVGEYSPTSSAQELADFAKLDANGDGLMTAKECVGKPTTKPGKKSTDATSDSGSTDGGPAAARPNRGRKKTATNP